MAKSDNIQKFSFLYLIVKSKKSFTKVQCGMPFENVTLKVKVMLSFGHKADIL